MSNNISIRAFYPVLLLLIPLVAMQVSEQVNWSLSDFVIMGILLLFLGIGIDYTIRKFSSPQKRVLLVSLIIIVFLLIWAELAVGVFGTPFAGS